MLIVSNNAFKFFDKLPDNTIARVNCAWCNSIEELCVILTNCTLPIYLDYPSGRTKPPQPRISIEEIYKVIEAYQNKIKYFAVSNCEQSQKLKEIRSQVPKNIKIIPKIETLVGVKNFLKICQAAQTDTIMLDGEDLYLNVKQDAKKYSDLRTSLILKAKKYNIKTLLLQGVIFSERTL